MITTDEGGSTGGCTSPLLPMLTVNEHMEEKNGMHTKANFHNAD